MPAMEILPVKTTAFNLNKIVMLRVLITMPVIQLMATVLLDLILNAEEILLKAVIIILKEQWTVHTNSL